MFYRASKASRGVARDLVRSANQRSSYREAAKKYAAAQPITRSVVSCERFKQTTRGLGELTDADVKLTRRNSGVISRLPPGKVCKVTGQH